MADFDASIGLDDRPVDDGLRRVKSKVSGLESTFNKVGKSFAASFTGLIVANSIIRFGKELVERGREVSQLSEKLKLSTDEVQLLQIHAMRTGKSFEDMTGSAESLALALSQIRNNKDESMVISKEDIKALDAFGRQVEEIKLKSQVAAVSGRGLLGALLTGGVGGAVGPSSGGLIPNLRTISPFAISGAGAFPNATPEAVKAPDPFAAFEAERKAKEWERIMQFRMRQFRAEDDMREMMMTPEQRRSALQRRLKEIQGMMAEHFNIPEKMAELAADKAEVERDITKLGLQRRFGATPQGDSLTSIGNFLGSDPSRMAGGKIEVVNELRAVREEVARLRADVKQNRGGGFGVGWP